MTWIKELEGQDINKLKNVARVNQLFPEEAYNKLFPFRQNGFDYDNFIEAIASFPAFCNEYVNIATIPNLKTQDLACKRELATLLAHVTYETSP